MALAGASSIAIIPYAAYIAYDEDFMGYLGLHSPSVEISHLSEALWAVEPTAHISSVNMGMAFRMASRALPR